MTKRLETQFSAPKSQTIAATHGEIADIDAPTKLLVSVRDCHEWRGVIASQIDVIDLKEPRLGPLAPVDPRLWRQAAHEFEAYEIESLHRLSPADSGLSAPTPALSAALGETCDARSVADRVPSSFAFAKVGPSGCSCPRSLHQTWDEVRRLLTHDVELVAVAYADFENAGTIPPELVFREAAKAGFRRCLVDTFLKDGRSTIQHMGVTRLRELTTLARQQQLWWTLAGSIKLDHLSELITAEVVPNCIGVRGDVCEQGRAGRLNIDRVKSWRNALNEFASGQTSTVNRPS